MKSVSFINMFLVINSILEINIVLIMECYLTMKIIHYVLIIIKPEKEFSGAFYKL